MNEKVDMQRSRDAAADYKQAIRRRFLENVASALWALVLFAYPISMWRVAQTRLLPMNIVHTVLAVIILVFFLYRKKFSDVVLLVYSIALFGIVSIGGVLQYGVMSGGYLFAISGAFICAVAIGKRSALAFLSIFTISTIVSAYLYISGTWSIQFDPKQYFLLPGSWGAVGVSFIITSAIFIFPVSEFIKDIIDLADKTEQQRIQIERMANHDALTDLPSLRLASDRLEVALHNAKRLKKKIALLFLDLNGFKNINDRYGHESGDYLLKAVAEKLLKQVRAGDTVCRIGGDEFTLLLNNVESAEDVGTVCQRIIKVIEMAVEYQGNVLKVGASIGVAFFPDNADNPKQLLRMADRAMYAVKRSGRSGHGFAAAVEE